MDADAVKQQYENEIKEVEQYLNHPITKAIIEDSKQLQNAMLSMILEDPVTGIESFLNREQLLGHLRGLRRAEALMQTKVAEIREKLEEIV